MFPLATLKEFMDNPMGKGSMAITNRQLIKDDFARRYNELKKKKKFKYNVYRDGDEYYFHILVPSESERENTYDVVLHFTSEDENFKYDNFLNRYYVKFFSNCPSFTFSFAFVFYQNGLMIDHLMNKYRDETIDHPPIIRNPGEIVSYEKSIMFACLFVNESFVLKNKMYLNQLATPLDIKDLNTKVRNVDTIELQIKKENNILKEKKKKEEDELLAKKKETKSRGTKAIKPKITATRIIRGKKKIVPKEKIKPK